MTKKMIWMLAALVIGVTATQIFVACGKANTEVSTRFVVKGAGQ